MLKGNRVTNAFIVMFLVFALCIAGCSGGPQEKDDTRPGNGAPVSGNNWPNWAPAFIPEYQYGSVFMALEQNGGGSIIFADIRMDRDPYGSYKKDLLDKGWEVEEETENEEAKHLHMKHDGYWLTYAFPKDGEGVSIYFGNGGKENGQASNGMRDRGDGPTHDWPSDMPPFVPQVKGDIISLGYTDGEVAEEYSMMLENMEGELDYYESEFKAKGGWSFSGQDMGKGLVITAYHQEGWLFSLQLNREDNIGLLYVIFEKDENGQTANGSNGSQPGQRDAFPPGIPDYVPLLRGDIISSGRDETDERIIYYVVYENIQDAGMDSYEDQLKAKGGWTVFLKQEIESRWMLHAQHEKKGDLVVTANSEDKIGSINFGMDK